MNKIKGWKTVMFNMILVATGSAEMAGIQLPDTFAQDLNGAILAGIGVVGIILRAFTNSGMGKK
jgi:uncharacterized membrane protein